MFVNGSSFAFCRNLKLIVHDDHPIFCVTSHELYIKSSMTVVCVFGLQEEIYEVSEGMKSFDELSLQLSEYDYLARDSNYNNEDLVMVLNSERIPILKLPQSVISLDESAMSYSFYAPFSINKTGHKMINPTMRSERLDALRMNYGPDIYVLYKVFTTEMTPASWEHNVPTAVKNTDKLILNRDRLNRYSVIDRKNYIEYEYVEVDEKGCEVLINTTRILAE
ncbi:hypothetical protein TVAG_133250 [Trichomonas vaginalis G3]|uniref:Uncharacterized protein n=1 Tax=Trichomonas vaginalis (strain ATCC PRA-98 / G3) TaxID=412133 RepID=A2EDK2_TRIV3|nr:hypothetical protein TVAGG3_0905940 [Trichomonas vaginalis G3]EAY09267.1 hypothetical protein TVAG_133250 [Trichomonas vaginalis G3]KAI5484053.1 hypothetical protein TVAGG3_0905940 [Trichomonas vaginalis G3]|eukprot:XP_001321490.1 hypothetical protein [Trichomonas vaginalis G3]